MIELPEIPYQSHYDRKATLVELGYWGLTTGRGWLVHAVHAALQREGLCDA
jgi:hypothetical protein